jgi:hypothetical protein
LLSYSPLHLFPSILVLALRNSKAMMGIPTYLERMRSDRAMLQECCRVITRALIGIYENRQEKQYKY